MSDEIVERLRYYVEQMARALVNCDYQVGMKLIDDYEAWSGTKYEEWSKRKHDVV
jgi:hypothetical protein